MIILELIYKFITRIRNYLYDIKFIKPYKSKPYIISIGNIIAGGTGKTPLIISIAEFLIEAGLRVGIVAGGYKRKSAGLLLVHNVDKLLTSVDKAGDEAYLLAEKLRVPLIVHNKKYMALMELDKLFEIDVVLIDDGFQHRKIERDLDIVIVNLKTIEENHLIPKGYLREEKCNLNRADMLIYRDTERQITEFNFKDSFKVASKINSGKVNGDRAIVLTSIANPSNFVNFLKENNATIENLFAYTDHHFFEQSDINEVIEYCKSNEIDRVYVTEKDNVKLSVFANYFLSAGIDVICVELDITFEKREEFENYLLEKINEKNSKT